MGLNGRKGYMLGYLKRPFFSSIAWCYNGFQREKRLNARLPEEVIFCSSIALFCSGCQWEKRLQRANWRLHTVSHTNKLSQNIFSPTIETFSFLYSSSLFFRSQSLFIPLSLSLFLSIIPLTYKASPVATKCQNKRPW